MPPRAPLGTTLSFRRRLIMMRDAICGIAHLHDQGYMHCDIKSLNFLVAEVSLFFILFCGAGQFFFFYFLFFIFLGGRRVMLILLYFKDHFVCGLLYLCVYVNECVVCVGFYPLYSSFMTNSILWSSLS